MTASTTGSGQPRENARGLAEQALHLQAQGKWDDADRLFAEAQQADPDAVAEVLNEHDAALGPPDARDEPTADLDADRVRQVAYENPAHSPGSGPVMTQAARSSLDPAHPLIESDRIEGITVYDANGKRIGAIRRLIIEKVSGHVVYAVTALHSFLGLEAETHTIPWGQLQYDPTLGGYKINITEDRLRNAPEFSQQHENLLSHHQRKELNEYYSIPPPG